MESHLSATQAARTFSDLLNRVRYRNEEFVIERSGEPLCRMVPVKRTGLTGAALKSILTTLPRPDAEYWTELEGIVRNQPQLPDSKW